MKKLSIQAALVIFGIIVGGTAGGYLTFHRYARDYALVRAFAWAGIFDAVSVNQYNENSKDAKQELLSTLSLYTQGVRSSTIDPTMKSALRMNCGLLEARLSVIESESGDVDRAKSYLAKAQEDLKAVGWVDLSEANILQTVKRQQVPPCGPAPQNAAENKCVYDTEALWLNEPKKVAYRTGEVCIARDPEVETNPFGKGPFGGGLESRTARLNSLA